MALEKNKTMTWLRWLGFPAILFVTLHCPALGWVTLSPIVKPTAPGAWTMQGRSACTPLLNAPTATNEAPSQTKQTSARQKIADNSNNKPPQPKGVWAPPSQNVEQRRGNIFSVRQPEDLLDFVVEDERLSVVKVYASWCKTCKQFDMRYRKIASQFGDKYNDTKTAKSAQISKRGRARFAEMELKGQNAEILYSIIANSKQPISLPYILMYKGSSGMVKDFNCIPSKFRVLADAVNELADPVITEDSVATNGTKSDVNGELNVSPSVNKNGDCLAPSQWTMGATKATSGMGLNATQLYLSKLGSP